MTPKIVNYGGWIGIYGLPIHWWTKEIFIRIGRECGGLLEVDWQTDRLSYLFEAKIKIRTNFTGLLLEILEIT